MIWGFNEAVSLFVRACFHFAVLLAPCLAICVLAVRRGIRDTVLLAGIGLAATALSGYALFFIWFLSFRLVTPLACILGAGALLYLGRSFRRLSGEERTALQPLLCPTLLVLTSALLVLSSAFVYGGFYTPLEVAQNRFSEPLPGDNSLAFVLGEDMMGATHTIPHPFYAEWLASDRPPLQAALFVAQYSASPSPRAASYEVLSALAQSFWIFGLWLLLFALKIHRRAIAYILAGSLFTSFVFVNTLFVWPKLLAASYFLGFAALLVGGRLGATSRDRLLAGVVAGVLCAWSFLSHGGTVFVFLGIAPFLFALRRRISWRPVGLLLVTTVLLYIPWTLYQKLKDPPGDRLLKWHLAGVVPVDPRPSGQTLADSYRALTFRQILELKQTNLVTTFTHLSFFDELGNLIFRGPRTEPARSYFRKYTGRRLNSGAFFLFVPNVGFYILGLPLLLFGLMHRFRSAEWKTAAFFWSLVAVTNAIWCLMMFGPNSSVVHQGSYAPELLAYAAGILCFWSVSEALAAFFLGLQIVFFALLEFVLLAPGGSLLFCTMALAIVSLFSTFYLLYRIAQPPFGITAVLKGQHG